MRTTRTLWGAAALALALAVAPAPAQESRRAGPGDRVTIDVPKDTPIPELLDSISEQTGRPVVYDPRNARIKATVGARFTRTVPRERLFDSYRSLLSFYELTMVRVGPKGYEIYLVQDSRSTNNLVRNRVRYVDHRELDRYTDRDGLYILTVIPILNMASLVNLRQALARVMSPAGIGHVQEVPGARSLLLMDYAPTVAQAAKAVTRLDVDAEAWKLVMEAIELQHAHAEELAETLGTLIGEPKAEAPRGRAAGVRPKPRVVAHEPRNALVVYATKSDFEMIRAVVASLDRPAKQRTAVESTGP
ncbi:MAG: secretin N-terminal domain-containing protein [Planctomycetota bacterium]